MQTDHARNEKDTPLSIVIIMGHSGVVQIRRDAGNEVKLKTSSRRRSLWERQDFQKHDCYFTQCTALHLGPSFLADTLTPIIALVVHIITA